MGTSTIAFEGAEVASEEVSSVDGVSEVASSEPMNNINTRTRINTKTASAPMATGINLMAPDSPILPLLETRITPIAIGLC